MGNKLSRNDYYNARSIEEYKWEQVFSLRLSGYKLKKGNCVYNNSYEYGVKWNKEQMLHPNDFLRTIRDQANKQYKNKLTTF
jgi:hypothetical protein